MKDGNIEMFISISLVMEYTMFSLQASANWKYVSVDIKKNTDKCLPQNPVLTDFNGVPG